MLNYSLASDAKAPKTLAAGARRLKATKASNILKPVAYESLT